MRRRHVKGKPARYPELKITSGESVELTGMHLKLPSNFLSSDRPTARVEMGLFAESLDSDVHFIMTLDLRQFNNKVRSEIGSKRDRTQKALQNATFGRDARLLLLTICARQCILLCRRTEPTTPKRQKMVHVMKMDEESTFKYGLDNPELQARGKGRTKSIAGLEPADASCLAGNEGAPGKREVLHACSDTVEGAIEDEVVLLN
ncbi:hypothetical protein cyc_02122 [Cyclospora cayetanensis]|uniref:Uncharacterized protein n=1 Tax=Cyclospora cayetanensis TaxID=88456 RepID=A0A1D3CWT1_9EIME|nr:hypothetical protein cyc_02122 [Cyclospora cayetanensis]